MYLKEVLEEYKDKKIDLFVDMDGVIADFDFGNHIPFDKKRPLIDSINKLKIISEMPNVELFILSTTSKKEGIEQKHWWLDNYAPFFIKENRVIIYKDKSIKESNSLLKAKYLKDYKRDNNVIIVIDDDPENLVKISELNKDIVLLKDTVLVDDSLEKRNKVHIKKLNKIKRSKV